MPRAIDADWDEDELADEQPLRGARSRLPWLRMGILSGLTVAVLVHFARQAEPPGRSPAEPKDVPVSTLIAPPPSWQALPQANAAYGVEKAFAPATFTVRQHSSGAREETLMFGRFGDPRHARISLVEGPVEEQRRSFFVDLVRKAAEAGLSVTRNTQSQLIATKFGSVEIAEVTLAGVGEQTCQAFRFADSETAFGFQGWLCGSEAQNVDATQAACFIDRIALAGTDSLVLKAFFARAERKRTDACGPAARTAAVAAKSPGRP
ncbi:hypothetical protein [Microvirga rosea]|uniref:hypothetical protein n=1 Tax=Microvirga rosea TaxID=2715425 RepID=UPI001D0ADB31|nr:hypothetical protein [Microvirga rosea]MCB8819121.1 hypothetical protein [Microvirga rosea]